MNAIVKFLRQRLRRPTRYAAPADLRKFFVTSAKMSLNVSIALVLVFGTSVHAGDPQVADETTGTLQVASTDATLPDLHVQFETKIVNASQAPGELGQALNAPNETTLVSSDESVFLEQAVQTTSENSGKDSSKKLFLLPFGKAIRPLADQAGGINQLLRHSGMYFADTFKQDKIGVSIATFTLANEIFRWVHVTTATNFVVTSNIIYSIVWASIFLNKDTWSKTTKPIQKTLRRMFKMSEVIPETPTATDVSLKFLSGLTLSLILNSGRAGLVGIDQLAHQAFDPLNLSMPFIMGAVMTAVGFSWSELMGSIDETRFPRSKKIMRLMMNSRSCLISYFAASAMLMNPEHYGLTPWVAVTLSGVSGLLLYTNAKRFLPSIERMTAKRCEAIFSTALVPPRGHRR